MWMICVTQWRFRQIYFQHTCCLAWKEKILKYLLPHFDAQGKHIMSKCSPSRNHSTISVASPPGTLEESFKNQCRCPPSPLTWKLVENIEVEQFICLLPQTMSTIYASCIWVDLQKTQHTQKMNIRYLDISTPTCRFFNSWVLLCIISHASLISQSNPHSFPPPSPFRFYP